MSCPVLLDPACVVGKVVGSVIGAAAGTAADDALSGIAGAIQSGVSWIVTSSIDWWVQLPSPDLAAEPAVGRLQQWTLPIAVAVAVAGLIIAGARMALSRKANPLIDAGSGLFTIAATSAVGVLLPTLLLKAGDAWSTWILNASAGGQFAARLTGVLTLGGAAPAVVVVLGIVAIVISAIQAVLMLFRQGALVILAGMMPLAAAGTLTPGTRSWFKRVAGWELALIFYKPAAALVYATAFTLIGTGKSVQAILTGFAMVVMSLLALPVLMRFFSWTTGQVADSAAGGGFLQTALSGAVAVGALRGSSGGSGGSGAAEQARLVSAQLGPSRRPGRRAGARCRGPAAGRPARPGHSRPGRGRVRHAGGRVCRQRGRGRGIAYRRRGLWCRCRRGCGRRGGRGISRRGRRPGRRGRGRTRGGRAERGPQGNGGHAAAAGRGRRPVMNAGQAQAPRDYGGWRRRRGIGLAGLGPAGTLAVLGALLVLIIVAAVDARALLYVAPPVLAGGGLGLARAGGEPLALAALRRARWWYGSSRDYTRYRVAVVAEHSPAYQLPGVLAPLALLDAEDGYGGRYGIVADRRAGLMTATLRVIPASTWLANRADADTWVANWGGWLASLGYLPAVRWVTVTIDTAPEPGSTLADSVAAAIDPAAPLAARQIMGQLVEAAPAAAADVDTRVSITFDPKASPSGA